MCDAFEDIRSAEKEHGIKPDLTACHAPDMKKTKVGNPQPRKTRGAGFLFFCAERLVKDTVWLCLLLVIAAVTLSSCGISHKSNMVREFNGEIADDGMGIENPDRDDAGENSLDYKGLTADDQNPAENKKIIKNADLDVEAADVKDTYNKIINWAKQNGGYEFSQELNINGNYHVINANIRISPKNLDAFIDFIGECSDIINCSVASDDITSKYFDTELRLKSMRSSLDAYYKLLANAKSIDEILKVQRIIDDITAQIESMQGQLNMWDKQVSESTVTLYMREKSDPVKISKEIDWNAMSLNDMWLMMKNGFLSVSNVIVSSVQWIMIALVSAFPFILIGGAILAFIIFIKRRKNKK